MPTLDFRFTVDIPKSPISALHRDINLLKTLARSPNFGQIHDFEPLAEGTLAECMPCFGTAPVRWKAPHTGANRTGFTDMRIVGPHAKWERTHTLTKVNLRNAYIHRQIAGVKGRSTRRIFTPFLFSKRALPLLFTAREPVMRSQLRLSSTSAGVLR